MRTRHKLYIALALAMLSTAGVAADAAPAPAQAAAYPYGYMNPFDPNWWWATTNNMLRLYAAPLTFQTAATTPSGTAAPAQPYPYANPFDPNVWLANAPAAAGSGMQPAPAAGSAYVPMQTPYGTVYVFNYADPAAWTKMFAQPFGAPATPPAK